MRRFLPSWLGGHPQPNIFWVTPTLAVGGEATAASLDQLQRLGIRAVLDLQAETADRGAALAGGSLLYRKIEVADFQAPTQDQLHEATAWVLEQMQAEGPVFIHCRMGLGRSVTIAMATLMLMGYELAAAYTLVRKSRPEIRLSDEQLTALREFATRAQS
jgi:protein-tyrosine phosphatase